MVDTTNLVSYYKCDDNGTFPDAHGSVDGTISGGASYTSSGLINGAYEFDGIDGHIYSTDPASFDFNTFSASVWFYKDSAEGAGAYNILNKCVIGNSGWMLYIDHTSNWKPFLFNYGLTGGNNVASSVAVTNDAWNHIVVTYDGSALKVYLNGALTGTKSGISGNMVSNAANFQVMRYVNSYLLGKVDEIAIFGNKALTLTEVGELYNGGSGLAYPFSAGTPVFNAIEFGHNQ